MVIIGLSGRAGSGKDHIAQLLAKTYNFKVFSFAHALKLEGVAHGFSYEEVFVTKPPHVRTWLQEYGVQRRGEDPEHWIVKAFQITRVMGWERVVFADVRFPNEAVACMFMAPHHSAVLRIDPADRPYPLAGTPAADHVSETAMDDFPFFLPPIRNGSNMDDVGLLAQLGPVVDRIL